jgi:hypothetical protein
MESREVVSWEEPCVLHASHSPVTIINERHHPFPQAWQEQLWGEVRDDRVVSVCATGHNSIHYAIGIVERTGKYPSWCVGKTRDIVEEAFALRTAAQG